MSTGSSSRRSKPLSLTRSHARRWGFDAVAFTDQISGNHPSAVWEDLPVAKAWGQQHKFLDASIVMALSAAATTSVELYLGAIDVVRHSPSKLAQHFVTLDHAAKGRAFLRSAPPRPRTS